jgi:hypothetical protein
MSEQTPSRPIAPRGLRVGLLALLITAGLFLVALSPLVLRGPRLGWVIERTLPELRGKIHVGGGRWTWSTVVDLLRQRPARVTLEDVRVIDPEGREVLRAGRISTRLELRRSAPHRAIVLHDVRIEDAAWHFARMRGAPGVGFLSAFDAPPTDRKLHRRLTGAVNGPGAGGAWAFELAPGARLEGVEVDFDLDGWGLVLPDVHGDGALALRPGPESSFTFEVTHATSTGSGRLRILDDARALVLPFERARIDRVTTVASALDSIALEASDITTGASRLGLGGTFRGVYGISPASRHPGLTLDVRLDDAADALGALRSKALATSSIVPARLGPGARLTLCLDGPFAELALGATLTSPTAGRATVDLHLAPGGGLIGAASFVGFVPERFVPGQLAPLLRGTLDGTISGRLGPAGGGGPALALEARSGLDLALTRPAGSGEPRVVRARVSQRPPGRDTGAAAPHEWTLDLSGLSYAHGKIELAGLVLPLLGGQVRAQGWLAIRDDRDLAWLEHPLLELGLRGERLSLERLVGVAFIRGDLEVRARVQGPLQRLAVELELPGTREVTVLNERFGLPARLNLLLADGALSFSGVRLDGPEASVLEAGGTIGFAGSSGPRIGLAVAVRDFPVDRLPGIAQASAPPFGGRLSGQLRLAGAAEAPALSGTLALDALTFGGHGLGTGRLDVEPAPRGGIHVVGRLIDGIQIDAALSPGRSGLSGQARVELARVRLDPFLPDLLSWLAAPAGYRATGVLSGQVTARVRPGQPASADARISELALSLASPPLELHTEGPVLFHAETGDGPLALGPVHLRGNLGHFELWAGHAGAAAGARVASASGNVTVMAEGRLAGRLELGALAPLAAPWVDELAGALDLDLRATAPVSRAGPALLPPLVALLPSAAGNVSIARALTFHPVGSPVDVRMPVGAQFGLAGAHLEIARLGVELVARGPGHGLPGDGGPGRVTVTSSRGHLDLKGRGTKVEVVNVDVPARALVERLGLVPGVRIDQAAAGVRLTGDPRRHLTLAGEAVVGGAHVNARAIEAALSSSGGPNSASPPGGAATARKAAAGSLADLAAHPEIARTSLDLRVRAAHGAVVVDVPRLPNLRVNLELHVGGTVGHPSVTGAPRGDNLYTALVLALGRLLR